MNKSIPFFLVLLSVAFAGNIETHSLTIKLSGVSREKPIFMTVYDSKESFLNSNRSKYQKIFPYNDNDTYIISDITAGNYALAVFQDINGNNKLDKSFIGIPKEPYGFSNNVTGLFGPPQFEKCVFIISNNTTIKVKLK